MTEQRRLAAIVSLDVAGYSRLMSADESGTLAALKNRRAELIDPRIAAHGGRIVKAMGDGGRDAFAHLILGRVLMTSGEVRAAIAECGLAVELNPNLAAAHFGLGFALGFGARQSRPAR